MEQGKQYFKITLVDTIQKMRNELGHEEELDTVETHNASNKIINQLNANLGNPEIHAQTPESSGRGLAFGGQDIISSLTEISYVLSSLGVMKLILTLVKGWIDLKKARTFRIEDVDQHGNKKVYEGKAGSEEEFMKVITDYHEISKQK